MSKSRFAALCISAFIPLGACATVSVYEPVSAEVSLTQDQSQLHAAAEAYADATRQKGLATGEASLASLAGILSGKQSDANAYWRRIGADKSAPAMVADKVRGDLAVSTRGLADLDAMARALIGAGDPARLDVAAFERALIHASQARDSLSDALAQLNRRAEGQYQIMTELAPLDAALSKARATADDLAEARAGSSIQHAGS